VGAGVTDDPDRPGDGPTVAVVVATNRRSPYLAQALTSLAAQTHDRWELVIADNGVPDPQWLDDVVERTVGKADVVRVPPSATVSESRNTGVAHTVGELVVFLDDDDVWHPERLARQVLALAADPAAPASYCGGWHLDAHGARVGPAWPATPATADDMLARRARLPHICGALMVRRADLLAVGGFSPEMSMLEDMELALRLLRRGTFACVPDELVGYRRHDGNATRSDVANQRRRRDVADAVLSRQAWAARDRGDRRAADLLAEHLATERREAAREAGRTMLWALAHGHVGVAAGEAAWGLRHDARGFVGGLRGRLRRRVLDALGRG
jgi:glycosyltransferase involved in cell wall biosynthesis